MELYVLSKEDLSIQSICKLTSFELNLDEETNAKSIFTLMKADGLEEGNFLVLNGLYRQFLFIIDDVQTEKDSDTVTVTALNISNIFDRKVIEKNTDMMTTESIEKFIATTMSNNFINSDDTVLNINYIDITWHTNTQGIVPTNAEDGLYNFHTFLTNCRQYKNIYTDFKFQNGRLKIDILYKQETTELIDTTLTEVTDYNKVYEEDVTAKVTVLIREDGSEYNLYLKTDKTTTTNKNDPNRASGKIEVISVDTADRAPEEALNVMKGNRYNHLVEFKIAKTSKLMDISKLTIGRPIRIKTTDDIYDSYISAITLTDENFVYFKSGNLRVTLIDKLKKTEGGSGNKIDKTGGTINGSLNVTDKLQKNGVNVATINDIGDLAPINSPAFTGTPTAPTPTSGDNSTKIASTEYVKKNIAKAFYVSTYAGILVKFKDAELLRMITIRITGNSYGANKPIDTIIQGYHFNSVGTFLNCSQYNTGGDLPQCIFMIYDGKICLWIPTPGIYTSLIIDAWSTNIDNDIYDFSLEEFNSIPTGSNQTACSILSNTPTALNLANYLLNKWSTNGGNYFYKQANIVTLSMSIRDGNSVTIGILPQGFRPSQTLVIPATTVEGNGSYLLLYDSGSLVCPSNLVGKGILCSTSFLV